jgi:hypothetical protein
LYSWHAMARVSSLLVVTTTSMYAEIAPTSMI